MSEVKAHPWTTSLAVLAFGASALSYTSRAPAEDVQALKASLGSIQVQLVEKGILDTRAAQCKAESKGFLTARLAELQLEYYRRTGREYRVPDCSELGS